MGLVYALASMACCINSIVASSNKDWHASVGWFAAGFAFLLLMANG